MTLARAGARWCIAVALVIGAIELMAVLADKLNLTGQPWEFVANLDLNLVGYAIVCLPILFAAGMSLFDTIDGAFMNFAYGWAFSQPVRKVYYNITITALSVAVAFIIGSVELLGILAEKLSLSGGFWDWVANLDLNVVGYAIVALFVLTWALALAVWKFGRIEERWRTEG